MPAGILHCYKTYKPDEIGGVAEAISTIVAVPDPDLKHSILVARAQGRAQTYLEDDALVHAVASLGMVSSMPVAPAYPFVLARMARSHDLLVHHSPFPLADAGLLMPLPEKLAVIVHWHADLDVSRTVELLITPLLRHSLKRADRIIVPHESVMQSSKYLKDFANKCVSIPYGVNLDYWSNLSAEEQAKADEIRRRHPRLIVSTGRLVLYKGQEVLLRAMQEVDGTLILVGKGPLQAKLQALAQELGIGERVVLAGWQDRRDLKLLLHAARVFAFPSVSTAESFGIAQLEAMAAGLPIVNTALTTAVPHVARHEIEALTVAPGDAAGFGRALRRLLDEPALATAFGHAARARIAECFDSTLVFRQTRQVYREAIEQRRGAAIIPS